MQLLFKRLSFKAKLVGAVIIVSGLVVVGCGGGGSTEAIGTGSQKANSVNTANNTANSTAVVPNTSVAEDATPEEVEAYEKAVKSKGFVLSTSVWTQLARPVAIPVCWINPTTSDVAERGWVQAAVQRTWEANSRVTFVGWGVCPVFGRTTPPAVRILINDSLPRATALGKQIGKNSVSLYLNFSFQLWPTLKPGESLTCDKYTSGTQRKFCIETIAVHEFGHALGFAHEQLRPDTPSTLPSTSPSNCKDLKDDLYGDIVIGAWDIQSIMNYCNPLWSNDGNLSATDIQTLQTFYGLPPVPVWLPIVVNHILNN